MIKEEALELLKTASRTDKPCRINHSLSEKQAVEIVEACVVKVADGGVLYDILEKRVRQMLVPINPKDAKIVELQSIVTSLKANSIALADHARFMSEAHDGGRCKAALKNHADLMEKLKEAGI